MYLFYLSSSFNVPVRIKKSFFLKTLLRFMTSEKQGWLHGGVVVSILTQQLKVPGLNPSWVPPVWRLHVLLVHVWNFVQTLRLSLNHMFSSF